MLVVICSEAAEKVKCIFEQGIHLSWGNPLKYFLEKGGVVLIQLEPNHTYTIPILSYTIP